MQRQPDPWIGKTLGQRYCLDSLLGAGGMGKVYKALDQQSSPPLYRAVKLMALNLAHHPEAQGRFQREMAACRLLADPLIVQVVDHGVIDLRSDLRSEPAGARSAKSVPYLVMEWISGETLERCLQRENRLSVHRSIRLAQLMASALQVVHQGVVMDNYTIRFVHRDFKPGNIFLTQNPQGQESIKLGDFGIVKFKGVDGLQTLTHTGQFRGTAAYSSPEQCFGRTTLDSRSDLYSFGFVVYEMVSGTNPFRLARNASMPAWIQAHINQPPRPIDPSLQVPRELERLIDACLEKDPANRPASAADLVNALQALAANLDPRESDPLEDAPLSDPFSPLSSSTLQGASSSLRIDPAYLMPTAAMISTEATAKEVSNPALLPDEDLEDFAPGSHTQVVYFFGVSETLRTTVLPDPQREVAQVVEFIHQLDPSSRHQILGVLNAWFTAKRDQDKIRYQERRDRLAPPLREWVVQMERLDSMRQKGVAIWLCRYGLDRESTLARVQASLAAYAPYIEVDPTSDHDQISSPESFSPPVAGGKRPAPGSPNAQPPRVSSLPRYPTLEARYEQPEDLNNGERILVEVWPHPLFFVQRALAFWQIRSSPDPQDSFLFQSRGLLWAGIILLLFSIKGVYRPFFLFLLNWQRTLAPFWLHLPTYLAFWGFLLIFLGGVRLWLGMRRWGKPYLQLLSNGVLVIPPQALLDPRLAPGARFPISPELKVDLTTDLLGVLFRCGSLALSDRKSGVVRFPWVAEAKTKQQQVQQILQGPTGSFGVYSPSSDVMEATPLVDSRFRLAASPPDFAVNRGSGDPWLGQRMGEGGRYHLQSCLGEGGFGRVYKGFDQQLALPVAIKFLWREAGGSAHERARFSREMKPSVYLNDPRIVRVYNVGSEALPGGGDPMPYLVMEYIDAPTLQQILDQEHQLSFRRTLQLAKHLAGALQVVHRGISLEGKRIQFIHRDLKPANVFVINPGTSQETVKLGDFGLVKLQGEFSQTSLSQTGNFMGTALYASPEQWAGSKRIDARADLYSLGVILYEMVSGTNPFGLKPEATVLNYLNAHLRTPPRAFSPALGITKPFESIVLRCLAKEPADRFSTASELKQALDRVVG